MNGRSARRSLFLKALALAFLLFLLAVAYWADTGSMPAVLVALYRFPNGDRLGHFMIYFTLAFLLNLAWPVQRVRLNGLDLRTGSLLAGLAATLEELSQVFIHTRTFDFVDLGLGFLGVLCADRLATAIISLQKETSHDHPRP